MDISEIRIFAKEIIKECEKKEFTYGEAELLAAVLKDEIRQCKEAELHKKLKHWQNNYLTDSKDLSAYS